jgi:hypothetical protein
LHLKAEDPPERGPIGLPSKVRLLALPAILDKGGSVIIMTNTLAYCDTYTAIITKVMF